jgi:choline dehydrogenase
VAETETFDYVIAGAGAAGCVLANRPGAVADVAVLLLEAGGSDDHFWIRTPLGIPCILGNPRFDRCCRSGPEPFPDGRTMALPPDMIREDRKTGGI